jgi:hypothetical protein
VVSLTNAGLGRTRKAGNAQLQKYEHCLKVSDVLIYLPQFSANRLQNLNRVNKQGVKTTSVTNKQKKWKKGSQH